MLKIDKWVTMGELTLMHCFETIWFVSLHFAHIHVDSLVSFIANKLNEPNLTVHIADLL